MAALTPKTPTTTSTQRVVHSRIGTGQSATQTNQSSGKGSGRRRPEQTNAPEGATTTYAVRASGLNSSVRGGQRPQNVPRLALAHVGMSGLSGSSQVPASARAAERSSLGSESRRSDGSSASVLPVETSVRSAEDSRTQLSTPLSSATGSGGRNLETGGMSTSLNTPNVARSDDSNLSPGQPSPLSSLSSPPGVQGSQHVDTAAPKEHEVGPTQIQQGSSGVAESPSKVTQQQAQNAQASPRSNLMELQAAFGVLAPAWEGDESCNAVGERGVRKIDRLHFEVSSIRCEAVEWQRAQRQQEADLRCRLEQAESEREEYKQKLVATQGKLVEAEAQRCHAVENGSAAQRIAELERENQGLSQRLLELQQQLWQAQASSTAA